MAVTSRTSRVCTAMGPPTHSHIALRCHSSFWVRLRSNRGTKVTEAQAWSSCWGTAETPRGASTCAWHSALPRPPSQEPHWGRDVSELRLAQGRTGDPSQRTDSRWVTWAEFSGWGRAGDTGGQVRGSRRKGGGVHTGGSQGALQRRQPSEQTSGPGVNAHGRCCGDKLTSEVASRMPKPAGMHADSDGRALGPAHPEA